MTKIDRLLRLGLWCAASAFVVVASLEMATTSITASIDYATIIGTTLGAFGFAVVVGLALYALEEAQTRRECQHLSDAVASMKRWEQSKIEVM